MHDATARKPTITALLNGSPHIRCRHSLNEPAEKYVYLPASYNVFKVTLLYKECGVAVCEKYV